MTFPPQLIETAEKLLDLCRREKVLVCTVESCTGGLIGALLTSIAGSSDVFERGLITYSNEAKMALAGVQEKTLRRHGAVSAETALEMATGGLANAHAGLSVAVTGIAGPGGGNDEKPVGLVYLAAARDNGSEPVVERHVFDGDRGAIRMAATERAASLMLSLLNSR